MRDRLVRKRMKLGLQQTFRNCAELLRKQFMSPNMMRHKTILAPRKYRETLLNLYALPSRSNQRISSCAISSPKTTVSRQLSSFSLSLVRHSAFLSWHPQLSQSHRCFGTSSSISSASSSHSSSSPCFHEGTRELRDVLLSRDLMGSGSVDLSIDEKTRIATVTLNHPQKR